MFWQISGVDVKMAHLQLPKNRQQMLSFGPRYWDFARLFVCFTRRILLYSAIFYYTSVIVPQLTARWKLAEFLKTEHWLVIFGEFQCMLILWCKLMRPYWSVVYLLWFLNVTIVLIIFCHALQAETVLLSCVVQVRLMLSEMELFIVLTTWYTDIIS